MAWGFEFNNLRPSAIGVNYLTEYFLSEGENRTIYITSDYIRFASNVHYQIIPTANISVEKVMQFPSVIASISGSTVTATMGGGNVAVRVLLYIG
jgi:hypothetical protein